MKSLCRLSVVIPTYHRCALVQRALRALSRQTLAPDTYEVIVSIDGSQDATEKLVCRFQAPYELRSVWRPKRGRAAACNAGIREAKGQFVVLLDDDMEPVPEFLAAHLEAHQQDSRLGIVGAVPVFLSESSTPVVRYIGIKFNRHLENLARPDYRFSLRDFYSGNFSIRRKVLLDVGAFNEAFTVYGNEDLELSVRLAKAGVQLVYSPTALAQQHYTKDFAALARDNMAKGRTAVLLATIHPNTFSELKLSTYYEGSRRWHLCRAGLLWLTRLWAKIPDWVIAFTTWVEQHRPAQFPYCCFLVLDYCYWLGVEFALRDNRKAGGGLSSLARLKIFLHDSDDSSFRRER